MPKNGQKWAFLKTFQTLALWGSTTSANIIQWFLSSLRNSSKKHLQENFKSLELYLGKLEGKKCTKQPKISNKWLYWYCCYLESLQNFLKSHFATNCIKSYLCYKRITSQNMCHLRHRLRIFLFNRKVMFRSRYIQVFVILTILLFIKYVTPWWVLVQETGCISEYIFWITTQTNFIYQLTKLGQLIDKRKGNIFLKSFEQFGELELSSRPFFI